MNAFFVVQLNQFLSRTRRANRGGRPVSKRVLEERYAPNPGIGRMSVRCRARAEGASAFEAPVIRQSKLSVFPRLQDIDIRNRNFLSGQNGAAGLRRVYQRLRIVVIHRVRPTIVIHPRRLGIHQEMACSLKLPRKRVGVDALHDRIAVRVCCGFKE